MNIKGLRCAEPQWAGVRYSLLANPPTVTGQTSMNNWIIEKAGVFDSRIPIFAAALQIDWNYHSFHALTIRDNYWNGLDIVYNDLTKKPTIRESRFVSNRRHGIRLRSIGLSITNVCIPEIINNCYLWISSRFTYRKMAIQVYDTIHQLNGHYNVIL